MLLRRHRNRKKQEVKTVIEVIEEVNYEDMLYNDLRQIAIDKGINTNKMKKADLVKALQELEG